MSLLEAREAYRLWAPTYDSGNALTALEQQLVEELGPAPAGRRLLDAGCGTGWRLAGTGAARAVGVDLSPEMLAQGRRNPDLASAELLEGDFRALPVHDGAFDLVWCRLAIGYVPDPLAALRELARVAQPGAAVIVTDFHPAARAAGLKRTFRHGEDLHELLTYPHSPQELIACGARAGLSVRRQADAVVAPQVRPFYVQAGKTDLYDEQVGQPMVLGLAFTRDG